MKSRRGQRKQRTAEWRRRAPSSWKRVARVRRLPTLVHAGALTPESAPEDLLEPIKYQFPNPPPFPQHLQCTWVSNLLPSQQFYLFLVSFPILPLRNTSLSPKGPNCPRIFRETWKEALWRPWRLRENGYVYVWLGPLCSHPKLSQHCELQPNIK